jgi:GT2 family glycosyltransferase
VKSDILPDLTSVVVVTADSGAALLDCVAKALASSFPVEVIVSDNASADGFADAAAKQWVGDPRLRIVRNAENLGFGSACNRGAAVARGDCLMFLNPDCYLAVDTVARLRGILAAQPDMGVLGAQIVAADGVPEPASRRRDPLLRRALMSLSGLARSQSRGAGLSGIDVPRSAREVEDVEAVSGALMLMPRAAFDKVHGFDEGYFLHCEDLDLCRRVRDAGWRVACANSVDVVHAKGGSSRHRPLFVAWHKHRGMWRWFRKFDPAARNPLLRASVWCGLWLHFALLAPRYAWLAVRNRSNR